jgi:PAS domain S-box-containing protein
MTPELRQSHESQRALAPVGVAVRVVAAIGALLLLHLLSRSNYLLFHGFIELFAVVVGFGIFVVAWNTRKWVSNDYLLFLGIAYLAVATVDVFHTLAYQGMGVFPGFAASEATQFWILARYIEGFSLLVAPLFLTRRIRPYPVFAAYSLVVGLGLLSICRLGTFPDCFVEGQGLTVFKVTSEYIISAAVAGGIVLLLRRRHVFEPRILRLLVAAMCCTIAAEMSFTLYADVYGVANMAGHLFKATSFYLVYRAVVVTSLASPYALLYRDLVRNRDQAQMYLDMAGTMLVALDRNGKVQFINRKGAEILGRNKEEILGEDWFDSFLPASRRDQAHEVVRLLLSGEVPLAEYSEGPVLASDGTEHLIAWHSTVLRNAAGEVVNTLSSGEDITERRRAEALVRESEQRFRMLFEHAPDAYYLTDLEGRFVDANSAAERMVGFRKEELLGKTFFECGLLPPDQFERAASLLARSVLGEPTGPDEISLARSDGSMVTVEVRTELITLEGRSLVLGIAHDVTARKQAEEDLRLQRDHFMSLFSNSPVGIALVHVDGRVVDVNDAFGRLFDYSREDVVGRSLDGLIVPDDEQDEARRMTEHGGLGQFSSVTERPRRRRDGSIVHVSLVGAPVISGGRVTGSFAMYRDETERRRSQDDLRASEEKFRTLFEQSRDAIYLIALDGTLLDVNDAAARLFGYSREDLLAMNVSALYATPETRPEVLAKVHANGGLQDYAMPFRRKDGAVRDCEVTTTMVKNEQGVLVAYQTLVRDVTERRRAEEETRRSEARLRSLVGILQHESATVQEFLDYALEESLKLTESRIGYIYFYDEERREFTLNTWSRDVMHECTIQEPKSIYQLEKTGIWGEAVRQRRPIVVNDFPAPHPLKKGYPAGHAPLRKYATIPVLSGGRIVAVVGVANKESDYTDTDLLQLTLLMDSVWKEVERKQTEEEVRSFSERLERAMAVGNLAWWQMGLPLGAVTFDERKATMLGYSPSQFSYYRDFTALLHPEDLEAVMGVMREHLEGRVDRYEVEYRIRASTGEYRWFRDVGSVTERDADGRPTLVTGVVVDISGVKSAEERLAQSNVELRDLAARLDVAREEERAAVAWELHDEVAQALSIIKLDMQSCSGSLPAGVQPQVKSTMERLVTLLDSTIERLRRLYTDLVPVMLEDLGLAAAIEWHVDQFSKQYGVKVDVAGVDGVSVANDRVELGLFRVLQETLEHVSLDHKANAISVRLARDDGNLALEITDNGEGSMAHDSDSRCAFFLAGIRERIHPWGGKVTVSAKANNRSLLRVIVPQRGD